MRWSIPLSPAFNLRHGNRASAKRWFIPFSPCILLGNSLIMRPRDTLWFRFPPAILATVILHRPPAFCLQHASLEFSMSMPFSSPPQPPGILSLNAYFMTRSTNTIPHLNLVYHLSMVATCTLGARSCTDHRTLTNSCSEHITARSDLCSTNSCSEHVITRPIPSWFRSTLRQVLSFFSLCSHVPTEVLCFRPFFTLNHQSTTSFTATYFYFLKLNIHSIQVKSIVT